VSSPHKAARDCKVGGGENGFASWRRARGSTSACSRCGESSSSPRSGHGCALHARRPIPGCRPDFFAPHSQPPFERARRTSAGAALAAWRPSRARMLQDGSRLLIMLTGFLPTPAYPSRSADSWLRTLTQWRRAGATRARGDTLAAGCCSAGGGAPRLAPTFPTIMDAAAPARPPSPRAPPPPSRRRAPAAPPHHHRRASTAHRAASGRPIGRWTMCPPPRGSVRRGGRLPRVPWTPSPPRARSHRA
jgi:hypothetical protein